jgi:hypothetical protein
VHNIILFIPFALHRKCYKYNKIILLYHSIRVSSPVFDGPALKPNKRNTMIYNNHSKIRRRTHRMCKMHIVP